MANSSSNTDAELAEVLERSRQEYENGHQSAEEVDMEQIAEAMRLSLQEESTRQMTEDSEMLAAIAESLHMVESATSFEDAQLAEALAKSEEEYIAASSNIGSSIGVSRPASGNTNVSVSQSELDRIGKIGRAHV